MKRLGFAVLAVAGAAAVAQHGNVPLPVINAGVLAAIGAMALWRNKQSPGFGRFAAT